MEANDYPSVTPQTIAMRTIARAYPLKQLQCERLRERNPSNNCNANDCPSVTPQTIAMRTIARA